MTKSIYTRPGMDQNKVVVTGLGAMTPLGLNTKETWKNIVDGKSGIDQFTLFDSSQISSKIGGEIKNFNPEDYIPKKEIKKMGRFIQIAISSAREAVKDSGLEINKEISQRVGVILGIGMGGLPEIQAQSDTLRTRGPHRMSPFSIPIVTSSLAPGQISIEIGAEGPNYSVASACASGCHAISDATQMIRNGICDVVVTGGVESTMCDFAVASFASMKALSTRNDQPQSASRPWDIDRDGFVLSEGSGILVLENYKYAAQRGAKIYAEVKGYGLSSDAFHITAPSKEGDGAALAMYLALKDAELNKEEVDYINAHGTSTPTGDLVETMAIKKVFKDHAKKLWVSSTKSMIGHTLGAAGAIESIFSILSLEDQLAPPTINLENPSEGCDLDYIPEVSRKGKIQHVLNNSFGFGGTNACVLFSKI